MFFENNTSRTRCHRRCCRRARREPEPATSEAITDYSERYGELTLFVMAAKHDAHRFARPIDQGAETLGPGPLELDLETPGARSMCRKPA